MITVLVGENDFALKSRLGEIVLGYKDKNAIEKIDASGINPNDLSDLLTGVSLFSTDRLVILYHASQNKPVWEKLADYIEGKTSTNLVLVETNLDKRTKTYKLLTKNSEIEHFDKLDEPQAQKWLLEKARSLKLNISTELAKAIVDRAGTDQWKLSYALERLAYAENIDESVVEEQIEASQTANVFDLVDATLNKNPEKVKRLVGSASMSEDPYFFFGLLSSQIFQMVTLSITDKKPAEVAKELGVHPYPLQKMSGLARSLSKKEAKVISDILSSCDNRLKRSGQDPWILIEQALIKLSNRDN